MTNLKRQSAAHVRNEPADIWFTLNFKTEHLQILTLCFPFNPPNSRSDTKLVTHLDKLGQNTKIISEKAFSSSVLNRDPFVFRGSAVSRVWTASPVEKPPAGLPLLPALLHPAHPRAARRAPQEPRHLLISIKYAQVGARVGVAGTGRWHKHGCCHTDDQSSGLLR